AIPLPDAQTLVTRRPDSLRQRAYTAWKLRGDDAHTNRAPKAWHCTHPNSHSRLYLCLSCFIETTDTPLPTHLFTNSFTAVPPKTAKKTKTSQSHSSARARPSLTSMVRKHANSETPLNKSNTHG
ncbi:unnamed protein product, partial [Ectocarpus sp. 12 AP-2014]